MLIFTSPDIAKSGLELAIARKSPGTYLIVFARAYGMAESRVYAALNVSNPRSTVPVFSAAGRPLIWLDADIDRDFGALGDILAALKAADTQVIQPTGRTQRMHAKQGDARDAHEVELILGEDQLARCCWYCDALEVDTDVRDKDRFRLCGSGEGYASTYMCHQCAAKSSLARTVSSFLRSFS